MAQPRRADEAGAAHRLAQAEPRLHVAIAGPGVRWHLVEARIGFVGRGGPFAHHPPAEAAAILHRGHFPLGLVRQTAAGPGAPGLRFVQRHVPHGLVGIERAQRVEALGHPGTRLRMALPVARCRALLCHQPLAAGGRPPVGPLVTAVLDEFEELRVGDRRGVDLEGRHIGGLRGKFVGHREAVGLAPALREAPTRKLQRAGSGHADRRARQCGIVGGHRQRLQQRRDALDLRVLVLQGPAVGIERVVAIVRQQRDPPQHRIERRGRVVLQCGDIGQGGLPARIGSDALGIEPFVGPVEHGRRGRHRQQHAAAVLPLHVAQAPPFGVPGEMAQRPKRRIGIVLARHDPAAPGRAERGQPGERAIAAVDQRLRQAFARQAPRVAPVVPAAGEIQIGKHGEAAHRVARLVKCRWKTARSAAACQRTL